MRVLLPQLAAAWSSISVTTVDAIGPSGRSCRPESQEACRSRQFPVGVHR